MITRLTSSQWISGLSLIIALALPGTALASEVADEAGSAEHQVITRQATLEEHQGPADKFQGRAVFSRFPVMPSQGPVAPATVSFAAGALTNWHRHPHGQYLIVVAGEGRTQEWGKPVQVIRQGDTVWCPPGVKHWHGGGEQTSMTHVAISPVAEDGQSVTWLEPVALPASNAGQAKSSTELVTLSERQLAIVPIAAFNATGDLDGLKPALEAGLHSGLTINEIKEVLSHQYAYVGFPRSLNGLSVFKTLLEERQQAGLDDPVGKEASRRPRSTDYYQLGTETLVYLTRGPASRPMFEFAPAMDHALKSHLFGYLFSRDNLSPVDRELTTIATLAAVGNVNSQLISHLKVAGNLGVSRQQLQRVIATLDRKVDPSIAKNAALQLATLDK